jgi:hypothetical protein
MQYTADPQERTLAEIVTFRVIESLFLVIRLIGMFFFIIQIYKH